MTSCLWFIDDNFPKRSTTSQIELLPGSQWSIFISLQYENLLQKLEKSSEIGYPINTYSLLFKWLLKYEYFERRPWWCIQGCLHISESESWLTLHCQAMLFLNRTQETNNEQTLNYWRGSSKVVIPWIEMAAVCQVPTSSFIFENTLKVPKSPW